jgi:crotonobetainyl-CoA:carnitine CoA-transferase CaiB-like acyl-CoA transferase
LTIPLAAYRSTGHEPRAGDEILSGRYACYNVYQTGDGSWLAVGALEPKFWAELCRRLGCADLIPLQFCDGGVRNTVRERIASIFRTRTAAQWFDDLRGYDCCVTPVLTISEVAATLPGRAAAGRRAPRLGEHTRVTLDSLGVSAAEIDALAAARVIQ